MSNTRKLTISDTHGACDGTWVALDEYEQLQETVSQLEEQIADLQDDLRESIEKRQELERELSELTPCPGPESE